jgi:SAM-dependent methyltransferase
MSGVLVPAGTRGWSAQVSNTADRGQVVAPDIQPLSHESTNQRVFQLARPYLTAGMQVLDLGAGQGYFTRLAGEYLREFAGLNPSDVLCACDVVPEQFRYTAVRCDRVGEDGRLPYERRFDLVCSLEVIEHVEDQFRFLREAYRVLKPGGLLVASTPNVLSMNSRWRHLHSGFAQLFDPLPLDSRDIVHTSGHIHPVSYYYLSFALRTAGFRHVAAHYDHRKRSALFQLLVFGPLILAGHLGFLMRMHRKRPRELNQNREVVAEMDSLAMLTSRSVIVAAQK